MITALDSNILMDIFSNSPEFADKSARALRKQQSAGSVIVCGVVLAEVATFFPQPEDLFGILASIHVDFLADSAETAIQAAKSWSIYRSSGGKRERLLADFLIAAHALTNCDALLTRDQGFYRKYFKGLKIIEP